ncbi:MAG: hypothetical protein ACR2NP_01455 [Pirellulaceae bacterium]
MTATQPTDPAATNDEALRPGNQLDTKTRWSIYWLLIICSLAVICARIWQIEGDSHGVSVPFLSANDRSRWCTIRSLGDHDTYCIDLVLNAENGRSWDTIDKVLHWGRDFRPHYYSSKPTWLTTVLTYPYVGLKAVTGWTLKNETFDVVRWMLVICQVVPLLFFFWSIGRIGDLLGQSEWTRMFLMGCATFGTFVTTFAVTLNNHLPAVVATSVGLYALIMIWQRRSESWGWYLLAGLATGFAAAVELPALAFLVATMTMCMMRSVSKTLLAFLPPVLLIAAGFFVTNHVAHEQWQPAYAHRHDGPVLNIVSHVTGDRLAEGEFSESLKQAMKAVREDLTDESFESVQVLAGGWPTHDPIESRWIVYFDQTTLPLVLAERADGMGIEIREWNNWYEYPGSYWLKQNTNKSSVDQGESDWKRYLFNLTLGHHGAFSLTPIWLLSIFGVLALCVSRTYKLRLLALVIIAVSVVVIAFYVTRPIEDRNYGGWTCGPRWLFWLIPLWLTAMIPALDALSESRLMRAVALLLLGISIASAFYAWANPWVHPWLYQWFG